MPLSTQAASSAAVAELVAGVAQTQIKVPWSAAILEVSALSPLTPIAAPASGQGGAVAVSGEAIGRDDEAQMDTGVDQGAAGGVDLNATPDATVYPEENEEPDGDQVTIQRVAEQFAREARRAVVPIAAGRWPQWLLRFRCIPLASGLVWEAAEGDPGPSLQWLTAQRFLRTSCRPSAWGA